MEIVPTILTADFSEFVGKVKSLEGIASRFQADIVDGKFVASKTVSLESLKGLETSLKMDLHLMVKEPAEWVNRSLEVLPDRLIGQVEMMADPGNFVNRAIEGGMEVGIALDLETPVETISDEVYHLADLVLVLAVKAGFSGQEFDERALKKIEKVRKTVGNLVEVGVDGGLNEKTILLCKKAGASIFYVGSYFWEAENLQEEYTNLVKLIGQQ